MGSGDLGEREGDDGGQIWKGCDIGDERGEGGFFSAQDLIELQIERVTCVAGVFFANLYQYHLTKISGFLYKPYFNVNKSQSISMARKVLIVLLKT